MDTKPTGEDGDWHKDERKFCAGLSYVAAAKSGTARNMNTVAKLIEPANEL